MALGNFQKKIILLLYAGLGLSFSYSPRRSWKIIKATGKEWQRLNNVQIKRSISSLNKNKFVRIKKNKNGTFKISLTSKGKKIGKKYSLDSLQIKKPARWDNKWRLIIFDIPEEKRALRDVFRYRLKKLDFHELQHSVWIHPYNCSQEIKILADFYEVSRYVHILETSPFENDSFLRKKFQKKFSL